MHVWFVQHFEARGRHFTNFRYYYYYYNNVNLKKKSFVIYAGNLKRENKIVAAFDFSQEYKPTEISKSLNNYPKCWQSTDTHKALCPFTTVQKFTAALTST